MKWLALGCFAITLTSGCTQDSCKEYSRFTCKQLEGKTYNVYYYDIPHGAREQREAYLGAATGLQSCEAMAWSASEDRRDERDGEWSYVCCLETDESTCAEKHR